jgi:hypothetical protein
MGQIIIIEPSLAFFELLYEPIAIKQAEKAFFELREDDVFAIEMLFDVFGAVERSEFAEKPFMLLALKADLAIAAIKIGDNADRMVPEVFDVFITHHPGETPSDELKHL